MDMDGPSNGRPVAQSRDSREVVSIMPVSSEMDPDIIIDNVELDEDEFESNTTLAILNSLQDVTENSDGANDILSDSNEKPTLEKILNRLSNSISKDDTVSFNIDRVNVIGGCLRAMNRWSFSPKKRVSVVFTDSDGHGEGAVDDGGPTREMWRLLLSYLHSSNLFEGEEYKKHLSLNIEALNTRMYFNAGRIIGMSIVHGGPGPNFMSEALYACLCGNIEGYIPDVSDITDDLIKTKITSIHNAKDKEELDAAMTCAAEYLSLCGVPVFVLRLEQKKFVVDSAITFYVIHRILPALQQLQEGLEEIGIMTYLRNHSALFKELFCINNKELCVEDIKQIFQVIHQIEGSNHRQTENRLLGYWRDYLEECFGKCLTNAL